MSSPPSSPSPTSPPTPSAPTRRGSDKEGTPSPTPSGSPPGSPIPQASSTRETAPTNATNSLDKLLDIVAHLRSPNGCPWDKVQTHTSLIPNLIEESYETADALRGNDPTHMCEELGDLLLQVVLHAQIAAESHTFTFDDIVRTLSDKLIRRHPHVFGDKTAHSAEDVISLWEQVKRTEKITPPPSSEATHSGSDKKGTSSPTPGGSYLSGTGRGLPALLRAVKLQKKAGKVSFDWPDSHAVIAKIREELDEVVETLTLQEGPQRLEEELGDLLFAVSNLCRKESLDPELALARANAKFERRFNQIEQRLADTPTPIGKATLETMDKLWNEIKTEEKATKRV